MNCVVSELTTVWWSKGMGKNGLDRMRSVGFEWECQGKKEGFSINKGDRGSLLECSQNWVVLLFLIGKRNAWMVLGISGSTWIRRFWTPEEYAILQLFSETMQERRAIVNWKGGSMFGIHPSPLFSSVSFDNSRESGVFRIGMVWRTFFGCSMPPRCPIPIITEVLSLP